MLVRITVRRAYLQAPSPVLTQRLKMKLRTTNDSTADMTIKSEDCLSINKRLLIQKPTYSMPIHVTWSFRGGQSQNVRWNYTSYFHPTKIRLAEKTGLHTVIVNALTQTKLLRLATKLARCAEMLMKLCFSAVGDVRL